MMEEEWGIGFHSLSIKTHEVQFVLANYSW